MSRLAAVWAALSARLAAVTGRPEPVALADFARLVLAAAVTVGWVRLDDTETATLGTLAAAVVWALLTWLVRAVVTPTSDPHGADGVSLAPSGRHARTDEP